MKQTILKLIVSILITVVTVLSAQDVPFIKNPAKPAKADAGRILELKEVMRITDEEGDFYFKRPRRLKVAVDESIFILEQEQFLHFDKSGKFLGNNQVKGEGPGEFVYLRNYFLTKNSVILYSAQPSKVIKTDLKGTLMKERKTKRKMAPHRILMYDNGNFWTYLGEPYNFSKAKTGFMESKMELCLEDQEEESHRTGVTFADKSYLVKREIKGGGIQLMMSSTIPVMTAADTQAKVLYVTNSQSYKIHKVNLEEKKITATFNRKYSSIDYEKPIEEKGSRTLDPPSPENFNDVMNLYFHNKHLWVITSTLDKEKGVLVDLFSAQGKLIDQFYLPLSQVKSVHDLKRLAITFYKDYIFVVEKDEEETPYIVKYQFKL
jgi:6-bladed beta-propeller